MRLQVAGEGQEDGDLLQCACVRGGEIPEAGRHVSLGRMVREALLPACELAGELTRLGAEFVHQCRQSQPASGHVGGRCLFQRLQGGGGHAFQQGPDLLVVGGQLILGQVRLQQGQRLGGTKLVVDVQLQHHPLAIPILLGIGIEGHFRLAFQQDQGLIGIALGQQEVRLQQLQLCLLHRVAGLLLQLLI